MTLINPDASVFESFFNEIGTTSIQLKKDVAVVKTWLQLQPHLPNIEDDVMLEVMLIRCKGSVEIAKQAWDFFFSLRGALPEFFTKRDPLNSDIESICSAVTAYAMPRLTASGYRILGLTVKPKANGNITAGSIVKYIFMLADIALAEDTSVGCIYIFDSQHAKLDYFVKWTVPLLKKLDAMLKMYKFRIRAVHIINAPPAADILIGLVKSVMRKKFVSRIHLHPSLESLYEHVDRNILPREYGGDEKSLEQLSDDWWSRVLKQRDWLLEKEDLKADEAKRPGKSFNVNELFGFEGTFKKLDVD